MVDDASELGARRHGKEEVAESATRLVKRRHQGAQGALARQDASRQDCEGDQAQCAGVTPKGVAARNSPRTSKITDFAETWTGDDPSLAACYDRRLCFLLF